MTQRYPHEMALRKATLERDSGLCVNCGSKATQVHHIVPRVNGGRDILSNLASLCGRCHEATGVDGIQKFEELQSIGIAKAKAEGRAYGRKPTGFVKGPDGKLQPGELGKRALELLAGEPDTKLAELAEELGLKDVNQAYRIRKACRSYARDSGPECRP